MNWLDALIEFSQWFAIAVLFIVWLSTQQMWWERNG